MGIFYSSGNTAEADAWLRSLPKEQQDAVNRFTRAQSAQANLSQAENSGGRFTRKTANQQFSQMGGQKELDAAARNLAKFPGLAEDLAAHPRYTAGFTPAGLFALSGIAMGGLALSGAGSGEATGGMVSGASTPAASVPASVPSASIPAAAPVGNYGTFQAAMGGAPTYTPAIGGTQVAAGGAAGGGWFDKGAGWLNNNLGTNISGNELGMLAGQGMNALGGYLSGKQGQEAAQANANAQLQAAKIAADAAKFKPVGVTTRFGQSNFGYDANGNLVSAGYTLDPQLARQQNQMLAASNGMLNQFTGSQAATAPMGQAAQSMFNLGQGYLGTSPQEQAAKYMADQQALLATGRADELAGLQNQLQQQGRMGLAVGGNNGRMATNPELAAYYNSIAQQDLGLAANATQGGMDYAKFGAAMTGLGGQTLRDMYGTQTAAYDPYQTAIGGAGMLENLGQGAMDIGTSIGAKTSTSAANAGLLQSKGISAAGNIMQPANQWSPWADLLQGAGQQAQTYNWGK